MTDALVSIIIPCYRQAHYLGAAVDSVLAQTYPRIEIIIVNDGSDDNTEEIARAYDSVRYIHQENGGPCKARNAGVQAATGEYLIFLDADDMLLPSMVERCMSTMNQQCAPNVAGVCCGYYVVPEDGTARLLVHSGPRTPLNSEFFQRYNMPLHTYMVRRDHVLSVGGFDQELSALACEDWDLWARIARSGAVFAPCRAPLVYYRCHPNSRSHDISADLQAREIIFNRHCPPHLHAHRQAEHDGMRVGNLLARQLSEEAADALRTSVSSLLNQELRSHFFDGARHSISRHHLPTNEWSKNNNRYVPEFAMLCALAVAIPELSVIRQLEWLELFPDVRDLVNKQRVASRPTKRRKWPPLSVYWKRMKRWIAQ